MKRKKQKRRTAAHPRELRVYLHGTKAETEPACYNFYTNPKIFIEQATILSRLTSAL